jgi:hypothetical protein
MVKNAVSSLSIVSQLETVIKMQEKEEQWYEKYSLS